MHAGGLIDARRLDRAAGMRLRLRLATANAATTMLETSPRRRMITWRMATFGLCGDSTKLSNVLPKEP